ncbi:MAG: alanyl-tRNA editing protein [Ruminococcaceae bacterium]|nr:alanyl-tRNA editing protein [Oscillospiraceae bacterium]
MNERTTTITERLYESDSHCFTFTATVIACEKENNHYTVLLDRTAFFPTGGGQPCDTGTLDGWPVTEVSIRGKDIHHTVPSPLPLGKTVIGEIHREERLSRMANHSGEHLLSAVLFRRHGLQNIGFHMGREDVTCDFDGVISDDALAEAEDEVNRLIRENHPVSASYPAPDVLAVLSYRSKLALTEDVRIVSIGNDGEIDRCACCAPHVHTTGEIGVLRLLAREHYKGGLRLHILCGADALARIREDAACLSTISTLLSLKPDGASVTEGVLRLSEELKRQKEAFARLNDALNVALCRTLCPGSAPQLLFDDRQDAVALRRLAVLAAEAIGGTVLVCGGEDEAYRFVLAGSKAKICFLFLKNTLSLRGGGSDTLICGSLPASRSQIEAAFATLTETK